MKSEQNTMLESKVREGVSDIEYLIELIEDDDLNKVLEMEWLPEFYEYNNFFSFLEDEYGFSASEIPIIEDSKNEIEDILNNESPYWLIEKISKLEDFKYNGIPKPSPQFTEELQDLFGEDSMYNINIDKMIKEYEKELASIGTEIVRELRKVINNIYVIEEDLINMTENE